MTADLHVHTTASDGHLSPEEIIEHALANGLTHIAITDHDTVNGILTLQSMGLWPHNKLTIIPGIEFSADLPGCEVHILGYLIDPTSSKLQEQLHIITEDRRNRILLIIEKLSKMRYDITFEDVIMHANNSTSLGRPHIAKALVAKGYFPTVSSVFNSLLYTDGPAYVSHYKMEPEQIISLIKSLGGVSILAHPGLINNNAIVKDLIIKGINGLEVFHPQHTDAQINTYSALAEEHALIVTGGSDFHAISSRFPERLGIFTVNISLASALIAFHNSLARET